jgi:hypothetical protein
VNLGTQVAAMGAGMDGISGLDMETLLGGNIGQTIASYKCLTCIGIWCYI